jgi:hypothetical protein
VNDVPRSTASRATRAERVTFVTLASIASLVVLFMFLVRPGVTGHPRADFPQLIDGTAHRPYVTRALVPLVVRALAELTPETIAERVAASLRGREFVGDVEWYDEYLFEFALATAVMLVCMVLFAWVLRRLSETVYELPRPVVNLAPIVALVLLPLFFRYYSYPYDPATLLLFSSALLFLIQRRFFWFVVTVVLASVNKETSVLLIPLFALHEWTRDHRVPATRLVLVALSWGLVRGALMWVYRDNPGALVESHFVEHTVWLFSKFPMAMRYTLAVIALFAIPVCHRWRHKPEFLRRGLLVTLLPLVIAGAVFGFVDELRGYYEAFPFLYLLALPSVLRWLGMTRAPKSASNSSLLS